jgi:DNA-binding LytR/AlgR family response regulator
VHRSYLVNLNRVKEIQRVDGGYVVVATDRDETHIPVARRQVREFREAVGI